MPLSSSRGELIAADWFRDHWALVPVTSQSCAVQQHERQRGDCRLIDVAVGPCLGERSENRIANSSDDGFYITLYRGGVLNFKIGGQDHTLKRGDMLVWDPATPSSFSSDRGSSGITIHFPGRMVERRLGNIGPLYGFKTDQKDPRCLLLRSHLNALCSVLDCIPEHQLTDLLCSTLELAYSCTIKDRVPDHKQRQLVLLAAVKADIHDNLGMEVVTPAATAGRLNINKRSLQAVLASHGTNFGELLSLARLNRACALLRASPSQKLPIQEIALSLGFYDASHFSNMFRRHFGVSPRQYRKDH